MLRPLRLGLVKVGRVLAALSRLALKVILRALYLFVRVQELKQVSDFFRMVNLLEILY